MNKYFENINDWRKFDIDWIFDEFKELILNFFRYDHGTVVMFKKKYVLKKWWIK